MLLTGDIMWKIDLKDAFCCTNNEKLPELPVEWIFIQISVPMFRSAFSSKNTSSSENLASGS